MLLETKKMMPQIRDYMNQIRESGRMNPLAATPELMSEFGLTRNEARAAMQAWMSNPDGTENQD